ncbi:MAG: hypothetical protein P1U74_04315 [Legionellaceae bacterium]|nr:hypothetical protein [Legionellaceae bacterium]
MRSQRLHTRVCGGQSPEPKASENSGTFWRKKGESKGGDEELPEISGSKHFRR